MNEENDGVKSVLAQARITKKEDQKIQTLIKSGDCLSRADFTRTAIREKLEKEELKKDVE